MNICDSIHEHKGKWKIYTKVLFWWGEVEQWAFF